MISINDLKGLEASKTWEELKLLNNDYIFEFKTNAPFIKANMNSPNIEQSVFGYKLSDKIFIFPYRAPHLADTPIEGPQKSYEKFDTKYLKTFNSQKKFILDVTNNIKKINSTNQGSNLLDKLQLITALPDVWSKNNIFKWESIRRGFFDINEKHHSCNVIICGAHERGRNSTFINEFPGTLHLEFNSPSTTGMGTSSIIAFENELTLGIGKRLFPTDFNLLHELCHSYNALTGSSLDKYMMSVDENGIEIKDDVLLEEHMVTGGIFANIYKESKEYKDNIDNIRKNREKIINKYLEFDKKHNTKYYEQYSKHKEIQPNIFNERQYCRDLGIPPIREVYKIQVNKVKSVKLNKLYRVSINESEAKEKNTIKFNNSSCAIQ